MDRAPRLGDPVYLADRVVSFGRVLHASERGLAVHIDPIGERAIPMSAVVGIYRGRVFVDDSLLSDELQRAVRESQRTSR